MRFIDKVQAISVVKKWSIQIGREYRVVKSKSDQWTGKRHHYSDSNYCSWYIHIKKKATHSRWEITRFVKEYTCLVQVQKNKHQNMSSKFISMSISHLVANDPEIPVSNVIQEVQAMQDSNPGNVYVFLHHRTSSPPNYVFKFLFWYFSPCIDGFQYCRPVIFVDGTHLRASYKGLLLIASAWMPIIICSHLLLQLLIRSLLKVGIGSSNI
ncbi:hypothetical protein M9H77_21967 [Catharanthus roseus]|uniref:Uncharacterized protein n=1 Tax=Catharanthus roseus TaxID=4058 RepID=A0ACC0APZ1_CATRO|nr:hypothetical protein M9H77_21967 [Catharanthus roseus]